MDSTSVLQLDMTALRRLIAKVLQLADNRVIFSHQAAPVEEKDKHKPNDKKKAKEFVTLGIGTSTPLGSEQKFDGVNEQEIVTVSKETTVSVNAFGKNAIQLIGKLETLLKTSTARRDMRRSNMALLRVSPIRNLSGALAGGYEERAQIDLTLTHVYRITTPLNRVESVDIDIKTEKEKQ